MTETARMQRARETGLPAWLFASPLGLLAKHCFDEHQKLELLIAKKNACIACDVDEPAMLRDAIVVHNDGIDRQRQYLAAIKKEWEGK
jgi:hypothetical protein